MHGLRVEPQKLQDQHFADSTSKPATVVNVGSWV